MFGGLFELRDGSPCINSGSNAHPKGDVDLLENPRVGAGTVDMGAFEFQTATSTLSYAWAQQNGIPTDGSEDHLDGDHDALDNWQEWIAGTIPTDALSVLKLHPPGFESGGVRLEWESVAGRRYNVWRSLPPANSEFSVIAGRVPGQAERTSVLDTTAPEGAVTFYLISVD